MSFYKNRRAGTSLLGTPTRLLCVGYLLTAAGFAQTVAITSPLNNGTSTSPVAVKATVSDSNPVSYTQIYVDGTKQ